MTDPWLPQSCGVISCLRESRDVFTLTLEPPPAYAGFSAGQFNMLYVPGAGEAAISISGDPDDGDSLVHTIRDMGNVTGQLHRLQAADRVGLRGPFGRGWPLAQAAGRDLLILAGGIGLAPLRPVLYQALSQRQRYRRVHLLLGARSAGDILYRQQLLDWKRQAGLELLVTVDTSDGNWRGDVGVITGLIPRLEFDPNDCLALICGPEIMMRFCVKQLQERGVADADIHVSLERNMKCALGHCGHCQLGPHFLCRDGPVLPYPEVRDYLMTREF